MAESFARRMMAQRLMTDARATPFSDSAGFGGRSTPDSLIRAVPEDTAVNPALMGAYMGDLDSEAFTPSEALPRVAYGGAAMGSLFLPGAGVTDVFGYAPDPFNQGEFLPSFGENIAQGNYLDAGLQTLGVAGDVFQAGGAIVPPLAVLGTALKAPRAARVAGQAADVAADAAKVDPNQAAGAAMDAAQARYFETGQFEPPTAENPVSVVRPTETEPGIIAFHGSGADFDEFRLEMIGTGEGAQAYGYGLYFTDSEDIAKFYRDAMADRDAAFGVLPIKYKGQSFTEFDDSAAAEADPLKFRMLNALGRKIESYTGVVGLEAIVDIAKSDLLNSIDKNIEQQRAAFANESASVQATMEDALLQDIIAERDALARIDPADIEVEKSGKMYKVALSPKPDDLLDYDEFFGDQNPAIKKKLRDLVENELTEADAVNLGYEDLGLDRAKEFMLADDTKVDTFLGNWAAIRGKDNAGEELLNKYGIPGLKYRASGSRGAGVTDEAAERNYVIFDDKAVKILEKYGIAGPVLVTGTAVGASKAGNDNEDGGSILPDAGVL